MPWKTRQRQLVEATVEKILADQSPIDILVKHGGIGGRVPIELKPYDNPARYNESLVTDNWDIGRAARDPARAEHLTFSVTFLKVDNGYIACRFRCIADSIPVIADSFR